MFCNINTDLERVPENLLDPLENIELMENAFPDKSYAHTYASYIPPARLVDYLQSCLDYPVIVRYQVIRKDLGVHTDIGLNTHKLNYLLAQGGTDVVTKWWDNDKVIHEQQLQNHTWYSLNVKIPHSVDRVISPRVSIVVRPAM